MVGGTRRERPRKQYARPGITLDQQSRTWQSMRAEAVQVGDTIPDWGVVTEIHGGEPFVAMTLVFLSGKRWVLPRDQHLPMVFAE